MFTARARQDTGKSRPRIGLVFPGPARDERSWSGIPRGLATGMREAGADAVHINAEPPRPLRFPVTRAAARIHRMGTDAARVGAEMAAVRTVTAGWRIRGARPLDGLVQIGTTFSVAADLPAVTFEDATVIQFLRLHDPFVSRADDSARQAWIERQRCSYERAVACCVASSWAAASVSNDYGIPASKVHVVGFGRNLSPAPVERNWSTPKFLFVGRDWERKNGAGVLAAFARLRQEMSSATLDVVGEHPELDVEGVTGHGPLRLTVAAERERLNRLFQRATCFVMPSRHEPFGLVYLEAAAAGIPSIGTTVGGTREAIGEGGRLVDPNDPAALVAAMRKLADGDAAARLGALARQRAPLFTWRAVAARLMRALGLATDGCEFL
jgi:glycosyltransferase involved in cell wall biosynthesis